jgi:hypothetical protein
VSEPLDNLQAIGDQAQTRPANWFNQLHTYSMRSRARLRRINRLALFGPRQLYDKDGAAIPGGKLSVLQHNDPADVEVLLERRDRYMLVRDTLTELHCKLRIFSDEGEPRELANLMSRMRQLEMEGERQLKAIEEIIWRSRDREFQIHKLLGQLISEGARLNQADRMHADRMSLERAMKPANSELEEAEAEWALKHGPELAELAGMDIEAERQVGGDEAGTEVEGDDEDDEE